MYDNIDTVTCFNVDVRVFVVHKDEKFDIVHEEAHLPAGNESKCKYTESKIIRKGKESQRNLAQIHYDEQHAIYAWMAQVHGHSCGFSRIRSVE